MNITKTRLQGVFIFEPIVIPDERGYFLEIFRQEHLEHQFGDIHFIQENESFSKKGVLRGLHYQLPPFAQTKLVRCTQGEILDVVVDIRKDSPTFGQYEAVILSAKNKKQLLIPKGFAHGFLVMSDDGAMISYKIDAYYHKESEASICYNDPTLGINWGMHHSEIILSEKDIKAASLNDAILF